ncbi:Ubiquitin-conjugating enzyme E2 Q2 (E2 ubiquitin-conjugating enzyme Q2) (Ubiquitin carrier protein Q2) (Ubiquitin-protein ligase Q2), partial [Durusdinium trenchii]
SWESFAEASAAKGSRQASQVLMREMRALLALEGAESAKALEIEMVKESLYHWSVKMFADGFPDGPLRKELQSFAVQHPSGEAAVVLEVLFPDSYPMQPPFIRIVRPRFQMHTGHITVGGSICAFNIQRCPFCYVKRVCSC